MIPEETAFKIMLKDHGHSITSQRLKVFSFLVDREPTSMNQIVKSMSKTVDRASIYRTLELFEKLLIVQRINIGWKYKYELSDKFTHHHHHLTCSRCGKVISINETELEKFINSIATENKFKAYSHQVEIQGECRSCIDQTTKEAI